jgi:excisionase family DNA binding protein
MPISKVGKMFGVHTSTVRDWVKDGKLPGHKVNNRWYVLRSDVVELARARHG